MSDIEVDPRDTASPRETARLAALYARHLLDTEAEPQFDAIVQLAAGACSTPIALISLVDRDRQWFKAGLGVGNLRETPRSSSFCSHAIQSRDVMEIEDALQDDRFRTNPLVTGPPHIRFYAGVPLEVTGGHMLGTLCVIDVVPRRLAAGEVSALKALAALAVHMIEVRAQPSPLRRAQVTATETLDTDCLSTMTATLESLQNGVIVCDPAGRINFLNKKAESLTLWSRGDAMNREIGEVLALEDPIAGRTADDLVHFAVQHGEPTTLPYGVALRRRDGSQVDIEPTFAPIVDAGGTPRGAVAVFDGVREASREAVRLAHLAQRDALTQLPNRVLLYDRIAQAIAVARRRGGQVALLFADLDRFKGVNDSYGHAAGDRLLKGIAGRLAQAVRSTDTVSRLGGDEFVLLLPDIEGPDAAAAFAQKVVDLVAQPYRLDAQSVGLGVSVGMSMYPGDADDPEGLISAADQAMYHAKRAGGGTYRFFTRGMSVRLARQHRIENSVRGALDTGAFATLFEPHVAVADGTIAGAGLLFARQRASGRYGPAQSAIDSGRSIFLSCEIGRWAVRAACSAQRALVAAGRSCPVVLEVEGVALRSPDFVHQTERALHEGGAEADRIVLCVKESDVMLDFDRTRVILTELKALGFGLALGGDGSGSGSLGAMRALPWETLYLGPTDALGIETDTRRLSIVAALIGLAHALGIGVTATGVDDEARFRAICGAGADRVAGRCISRPLTRDVLSKWLDSTPDEMPWRNCFAEKR